MGDETARAVGWITTALCLAGTVLNVKGRALCFWLWSAGNVAWFCLDARSGLWSRGLLDLVQLALAIWGIREWTRRRPVR